ncbi:MAG: hypothetical protein RL660_2045 [Bacteroidota bacterium]|jgi:hypothetical protein
MALPSVFDASTVQALQARLSKLTAQTAPQWGKMNVAQMLAHCNVTYDMIYTDKYPRAGGFKKFLLKLVLKPIVTNEKPYRKNSGTAPEFKVAAEQDFNTQMQILTANLQRVQKDGLGAFEGRESNSFGPLTGIEWSNMMYKHLDHHLQQFGV